MNKSLPRPERKLSSFVGSELLLDFVEGKLDGDRKAAIQKSIKEQTRIKENVEQLEEAIHFCNELSELKLTDEFVQDVEDHRGKIAGFLHKLSWSSWPDSLKWSSEAFLVSCFVAVVVFATPWRKAIEFRQYLKNSFLVSEQLKPQKEISISKDLEKANVVALNTKQEPEPALIQETPVKLAAPTAKPTLEPTIAPTTAPTIKPTSAPTPKPTAMPKAAPVAVVAAAPTLSPTVVPTAVPTESPKVAKNSFLHRVTMRVENIESKADQLAAQIIGLGGIKGGNVRIGWRKENGNYFHFTIPEENYAELIKTLSQYGLVTVYKNPHPRVLPEGVLRFIVWIEDGVKEADENSENTDATKTNESSDSVENGTIDEE